MGAIDSPGGGGGECFIEILHFRRLCQNHLGPCLGSPDFPRTPSVQRASMPHIRNVLESIIVSQ